MAPTRPHQRLRRLLVPLAVAALALAWFGCGSKKGFEAVRDFFDLGPPEQPGATTGRPSIAALAGKSPQAVDKPQGPISMQHKPFADENCRGCHSDPAATGLMKVETSACLKCHTKIMDEYPVMHGAVTGRACLWCHEPHEAREKFLLRTRDQSLCLQCHERPQLSTRTAGHRLDKVICLNCHGGHGGTEIPFLKPSVLNPAPATQPAK